MSAGINIKAWGGYGIYLLFWGIALIIVNPFFMVVRILGPSTCCVTMSMSRVHIHAACHMSMLPIDVNAACSSPTSIDKDKQFGHGHAAWICHAAWKWTRSM
jgi:hypothetical protein